VILAVTGQMHPAPGFGEAAVARWTEAGLLKPSVLKPVLATIERRLVLRTLGRLAADDQQALRNLLRSIIGS
jgi:mRNA interferase MazF